jgi:DNA polymerase-1
VEKDHPDYASHYLIRRSFIPRLEYFFVMMDYDQFEYRMMVNYARETSLIEKIQSGIDVHTATAELMGVSRKEAKTINFMLLYGGGVQKLAEALNVPLTRAKFLKEKYFATLPKVQILISQIQNAVCSRGYLENWFGRRYTLPRELAYKGPNYLIQGGCADWVKIAICNIHRFLKPYKSRILLQIHDELLFEIHEEEKFIIPKLKYLMENVSHIPPHDKLRYTVGIEYSYASWQDKKVWDEAGNNLQTKSGQEIKNDSP